MIKILIMLIVGATLVPMTVSCSETDPAHEIGPSVNPISFLSGKVAGDSQYEEASPGYSWHFPRDHGAHKAFRNEWWYLTGNLTDNEGAKYGFQLTIFRNGISRASRSRNSNWSVHDVYMGHFTVTDIGNEQFYQHETFSRDSLGLAGSSDTHLDVWIDNWFIRQNGESINIAAESSDVRLELNLKSLKPIVLQGEEGFSMKTAEGTGASHYYSISRMEAKGSLTFRGIDREVTGLAWMDREWSSSSLGQKHSGWDWFALHLADGSDLMCYNIRLAEGGIDVTSGGTFISRLGKVTKIGHDEVLLTTLSYWTSPTTNARYPSEWTIRVDALGIDIHVEPMMASQELHGVFRYWEGAVACSQSDPTAGSQCTGYVELTGY